MKSKLIPGMSKQCILLHYKVFQFTMIGLATYMYGYILLVWSLYIFVMYDHVIYLLTLLVMLHVKLVK